MERKKLEMLVTTAGGTWLEVGFWDGFLGEIW